MKNLNNETEENSISRLSFYEDSYPFKFDKKKYVGDATNQNKIKNEEIG